MIKFKKELRATILLDRFKMVIFPLPHSLSQSVSLSLYPSLTHTHTLSLSLSLSLFVSLSYTISLTISLSHRTSTMKAVFTNIATLAVNHPNSRIRYMLKVREREREREKGCGRGC